MLSTSSLDVIGTSMNPLDCPIDLVSNWIDRLLLPDVTALVAVSSGIRQLVYSRITQLTALQLQCIPLSLLQQLPRLTAMKNIYLELNVNNLAMRIPYCISQLVIQVTEDGIEGAIQFVASHPKVKTIIAGDFRLVLPLVQAYERELLRNPEVQTLRFWHHDCILVANRATNIANGLRIWLNGDSSGEIIPLGDACDTFDSKALPIECVVEDQLLRAGYIDVKTLPLLHPEWQSQLQQYSWGLVDPCQPPSKDNPELRYPEHCNIVADNYLAAAVMLNSADIRPYISRVGDRLTIPRTHSITQLFLRHCPNYECPAQLPLLYLCHHEIKRTLADLFLVEYLAALPSHTDHTYLLIDQGQPFYTADGQQHVV